MLKKISIIISGIFVFILFWYVSTHICSPRGNRIKTVVIGNQKFHAEFVSSHDELQKGLSGRKKICHSCAMLFQFPKAGYYAFWMKDMQFPLDIVWLNEGKIVHIERNVSEKFTGILSSEFDADQILEINGGLADKYGYKTGDIIEIIR